MKTFLPNTQGELIAMKQKIIDQCVAKELKCKDGARLLQMHPKAFSRLKKRYVGHGVSALMPKKPGPKNGCAPNRTSNEIEELVIELEKDFKHLGPVPLSEAMEDFYQIKIDPVTVWRILKRRRCRYTQNYQRIERPNPTLYCLDEPGIEIQLDGSYPFGRGRRIICFDAVDDCSRWAHGKLYEGTETTERAIGFVDELIKVAPFRIQRIRIDNKLGKKFDIHCLDQGIKVVRNDPYEATQNGKVERYHKTLKHKLFWGQFGYYDNFEILQYKLNLWLRYYNGYRRHGGYGMNRMTPNGKIASILAQKTLNSYLSPSYPQKVTLSMQQYKD